MPPAEYSQSMHRRRATEIIYNPSHLRLLLALAAIWVGSVSIGAENLVVQRFSSAHPDAELESVFYLSTGVALADLGYSCATTAADADYVLTARYTAQGSEALVTLSLAEAKGGGKAVAEVEAHLRLGISLDADISEAVGRLMAAAGLGRPKEGSANARIGGLFTSDLVALDDTMRTKKTRRIEVLAYGGGMYFVGDFSSYARFGAGASLDAGILLLKPSWSLSAGPRMTGTRILTNDGVEGGTLYLSTIGLNLQFGIGAAQAQRLSACASGGAAFITIADDAGAQTKTVPYADAGFQAGFPIGKDFFLGGDLRYLAVFEGGALVMAVAPSISLCKEL